MNRVEYNLPDPDYRKAPGISNSKLGLYKRSPAHAIGGEIGADEDTDDKLIGRVLHHVVLTPGVPPFWTVCEEGKRRPSGYKDMLKASDWARVQAMAKAVQSIPMFGREEIVKGTEVSLFTESMVDGVRIPVKARLDIVSTGNYLADLKKVRDASPDGWRRHCLDYSYYRQAAFYLDLWNSLNPDDQKTRFIFIAIEDEARISLDGKTLTHAVACYELDPDFMECGRREYQELLNHVALCMTKKRWPGYIPLSVTKCPAWLIKQSVGE